GRSPGRAVSAATGAAPVHSEGGRAAAAVGHSDGTGPSGSDGDEARGGARLRGGLSAGVLWIPAETERHGGVGGHSRGGQPGLQPRGGRRYQRLLGRCNILPPNSWRVVKELWMVGDDLDSQAFSSAAEDVDGFELAALYTLQHRLPGDAEPQPRFEHRQIVWWGVF